MLRLSILTRFHKLAELEQTQNETSDRRLLERLPGQMLPAQGVNTFENMNLLCRNVMQISRCSRALELVVQARWTECFDDHISQLVTARSDLSRVQCRMLALRQACEVFGQSEKILRNKMSVLRIVIHDLNIKLMGTAVPFGEDTSRSKTLVAMWP